MNLAARRSARLKERLVMRIGCVLVSASLVASLMVTTALRAKAVVATSTAASALAGAYLDAAGLTPVVSGMGSSQDVNESLARLIQNYLGTVTGTPTVEEWLGKEIGLAVSGGKVIIPRPVAGKLGEFAVWVGEQFVVSDGDTATKRHHVVSDCYSYAMKDGTSVKYHVSAVEPVLKGPVFPEGYTPILEITEYMQFPMEFDSGFIIDTDSSYTPGIVCFVLIAPNGNQFSSPVFQASTVFSATRIFLCSHTLSNGYKTLAWVCYFVSTDITRVSDINGYSGVLDTFVDTAQHDSLALDVTDQWQDALDRIASLEEQETIALDVGATDSMAIQDILQDILEAILAGNLAATAEIVDTAEVPEKPDPPVLPVVPSDLDQLGAALTSRFPFSIPWDIYKGVKLLAAPARAPYWEVDFLAPIAHRVGGWKGSTRIVLDFSEYEVIGQVCRWASTIGFCLMLASGTKRLIWTA